MNKETEKLAVQVAWSVSALIVFADPPLDLTTDKGVEEAGKIVARVCHKIGLNPFVFDENTKESKP